MIIALYCFINLALNLVVSTLIDTQNWQQWYYSVRTVNETFDAYDVTARSGSHLVMSSFEHCLQCILLSVLTHWINVCHSVSFIWDCGWEMVYYACYLLDLAAENCICQIFIHVNWYLVTQFQFIKKLVCLTTGV